MICPTAVEPTTRAATTRSRGASPTRRPNAFYANQYHNPANPEAHYLSTGPEIWEQTRRRVRRVRARAWAPAAPISGCGQATSRRRSPTIKIVGVDPVGSLYYDYVKTGRITKPFSYKVEGIGEDFLPVDDEPQDPRRHRARRRQGVLPDDARAGARRGPLRAAARAARRSPARSSTRDADGQAGEHPRAAARRRGRSTSRRSSTTTGCARTASSRTSPGLGTVARHPQVRGKRKVITDDADREACATSSRAEGARHQPAARSSTRASCCGIVAEVDLLRYLVSGEQHARRARSASCVESDYATVTPRHEDRAAAGRLRRRARGDRDSTNEAVVGILTKIDLIEYLAKKTSRRRRYRRPSK